MNKLKISYIINTILLLSTVGTATYAYNIHQQNIKLQKQSEKVVIKKKVYPKKAIVGKPNKESKTIMKQHNNQNEKQITLQNATDAQTALAIIFYAQEMDKPDWHSLINAMNHNSKLVVTLLKVPTNIQYRGQGVAYYLNTNTRSQGTCFYTLDKDNTIHFYSGLNKQYIGKATKQQVFDYINSHHLMDKINILQQWVNFYDFRTRTEA